MTTATNPPLGTEVFNGQQFETLTVDSESGRLPHYIIPVIDPVTRLISGGQSGYSGQALNTGSYVPPPGNIFVYWGSSSGTHRLKIGEYLPYPSNSGIPNSSQVEPVNQIPNGNKWLNVLSRFAHDLLLFNPDSNHLRKAGTHTTGHLPPTDAATMLKNKVTYQLGRAAIGVAFHRVEKWMTFDPELLAFNPTLVSDAENWLNWLSGTIPVAEDEIAIPNIGDMMALLCGDEVKTTAGVCVGAWVYRLNDRIDGSSYDSNLNGGGEIRLPDPAWADWRPHTFLHRVTGTRSQRSDQWDEIMGWFRDAHDHYLTSVAPAIEHS